MVSRKDVDPFQNEDWYDLQRYRSGMPRERAPVGQLSPQPWISAPSTQAVLQALQAEGQKVRFVGGCVRDAVCGRPVSDIDIATPDTPDVVAALLEKAGIRVVPTGIDHGTVMAVYQGESFEITTLRRDVETDGRHAVVVFTTDWMADAARRDLTINALSAASDGAIYDYFDGLQDLAHGRVRFVGRAMDRIAEDYLRILRFFRFHGRYGRGTPNANALAACRAHVQGLEGLSGERIAKEMLKILAADSATEMLLEMQGVNVLQKILPEGKDIGRLRQLVFLETRGLRMDGLAPDPVRRLGALLASPQDALAVAERWRLSTAQRDRLTAMLGFVPPEADTEQTVFRRILRQKGGEVMADAVLLHWSGERSVYAHTNARLSELYRQRLEDAFGWTAPDFPVGGKDLLAVGLQPGPRIGALLQEGIRFWEERDFVPGREEIMNHILQITESSVGIKGSV